MNVARKSTTKLPQKWQQEQKLESREDEADSGVTSTDSIDSFQDALLNLKALSGSGEMSDTDRSEVKEAQRSSGSQEIQNGDRHDGNLLSKENAEDQGILEQIDDIVNEVKKADEKIDPGSEEEDDILIIKEDESNDTGKESNGVSGSQGKDVPAKTPFLQGGKVRSTVNNILSKLVQSNPDVNNLFSKAKLEDQVKDASSASPVPLQNDKGNLFDNFEVSEKDSKSLTFDSGKTSPQPSSKKEDESQEEKAWEVGKDGDNGHMKCVHKNTSVNSTTKKPCVDGTGDKNADLQTCKDKSEANVKLLSTVESVGLVSTETTVETKCDALKQNDSSPKNDDGGNKKDRDVCSSVEDKKSTKSECEAKSLSITNTAGTSECKKETASRTESMEITTESCDKVSGKVSESGSVTDAKPEIDRKRPLKDELAEDESSQPVKRSRLDEVIGKLGERVTFPSVPPIDDFEDSTLGDTDSIEKQSEEISGTTSDEEEAKSPPDSKSKPMNFTKQEFETLVMTVAKKAIEQYQSAEILTLSRRVEEMKESQEEWRQKAKNLEREVLDLTVLQQRLEKRKAHAAALKSITTRSIGIWVTEDKFKNFTPQKHPASCPPPAAAASQGPPVWASSTSAVRSLVSEPPASSAQSVVNITHTAAASRNTSVAHLLSQTARMPTVASCAAANRSMATLGRTITTGPRMAVSSTGLVASQSSSSSTPASAPVRSLVPSTVNPPSSLVLVSSVPGQTGLSRAVPAQQGAAAATVVTPAAPGHVKFIDLTTEDDSAASKQAGKVVAPGGMRAMVPQHMVAVRQMTPISQTMPSIPSSAILLSSPAGTQIVNAGNIQRPGMLQVVTIANPQSLRPGSIFPVMPGQTGSMVRPPATAPTFTTNTRDSSLVMAQPFPAAVTFVRPPTTVLASNNLRPVLTPMGANNGLTAGRAPVALTTARPGVPVAASGPSQHDGVTHMQPLISIPAKKNIHPAPLPESVCPKGLPADLKSPPPSPGLKISRVKQGIVLSWNMSIPTECVDIASYQLFAYQETSAAPQTSLWKKVGDVKALPLPMACTLTQFQDGNKYHFAVRAIDVHGRSGPFSEPSYIFLTKTV